MRLTKNYFNSGAKDWLSESYQDSNLLASVRLSTAINIINKYKLKSLVDVGCGDGRLLAHFNSIPIRYGIDYSQNMIDFAKVKNKGNISFKRVNLNLVNEYEKFSNSINYKFDFMSMLGIVHYLDNPLHTISALKNILKKNSYFLISFRNRIYNIQKKSKYFKSNTTKFWIRTLKQENKMISNTSFSKNFQSISKFLSNKDLKKIAWSYELNNSWLGITDPYWDNPLIHWKQFTIIESLILLNACGFRYFKYIPLGNYKIPSSFAMIVK